MTEPAAWKGKRSWSLKAGVATCAVLLLFPLALATAPPAGATASKAEAHHHHHHKNHHHNHHHHHNRRGLVKAKKQLKRFYGPVKLESPGPPFNVSSAKGKTVMLATYTGANPATHLPNVTYKEAMAHVGVTVLTCNGGGTPTGISTCVQQGVAKHVSAITVQGATPPFFSSDLPAANKAHIPVFETMALDPNTVPLTKGLSGNAAQPGVLLGDLVGDWMILDSHDKHAHALFITSPDIAISIEMLHGLKATLKKDKCKHCSVMVKGVDLTNWATDIEPVTRAALEKDPKITYLIPFADPMVSFAAPAVKQLGMTSKEKILTTNGTLPFLKQEAAHTLIYEEVGNDFPALGYYEADQVLRMLTGHKLTKKEANYANPIRVFTRTNLTHIKLTTTKVLNGGLYGSPTKLQSTFYKDWKGA